MKASEMQDARMIQEIFCYDPWKMLVGCIMLNQTNHLQVRSVIYKFFEKWPNAESAANADHQEMIEVIRSLGFYNIRTKRIKQFSSAYAKLENYTEVSNLPGVGKYAADSYEIFVKKNYNVEPADKELIKYLTWHR